MEKNIVLNKDGDLILDSNIMVKGEPCWAGSKMLEDYRAPYSASLVESLEENDYKIYGLANTSEFSMADGQRSSIEMLKEVDGGIGLGTDTGGNLIRDLAGHGLTGFIPSKGAISSHGIIRGTSSFTRLGIFGQIDSFPQVLNTISGRDPKDPMTINEDIDFAIDDRDLVDYRIGIYGKIPENIVALVHRPLEVDFLYSEHIGTVFDVIKSVELASNTARYDGIRYGYRTGDYDELEHLYGKTRAEGFGFETKKSIIKGYLYSGYSYERKIYDQALRLRRIYVREIENIFKEKEIILARPGSDMEILASLTDIPVAVAGEILIMAGFGEDKKALSLAKKLEELI